MSRDIVLYIASSLDGYIARVNGAVDWLNESEGSPGVESSYDAFYSTVDTVIMGRNTYNQITRELSPGYWVYEGKKCYVATRENLKPDGLVEFISDDIVEFAKELKGQDGSDIWLVGGSKLVDQFVKQNLIDKYIVTIIPTILGEGIPLFVKGNPEIKLKLTNVVEFDGMVELTYVKKI
ncbi:dihydrofolate reductase [Andreesenia angusta]|uniref:Dihydrofolate reductase n=1 Tax=Andreesenia angusta TaxID=39480 RepID=A0A1S1V8L0_9FIRM|nr:dihydrofolate reductase family protein [Andreesenia angusta]OHW62943.1 dihydrofolate reductase [Andreesenia angusta]